MTDESPDSDAHDKEVDELLAKYLLAVDAGEAPDKEAWIAEHPEFSRELDDFLSGTEQFERLSESLHASMAATSRLQMGRERVDSGLEATGTLSETPDNGEPPSPWPATVQTPVPGRFIPGTVLLERYHVVSQIGKGGMGEVYRAYDVVLGDYVALKFLPSKASLESHLLERFLSEVRLARQINHENVCGVYDIGDMEGEPFISMEYVDGEDLASLLHRVGRLPVEKALSVTSQLCAGLSAAHERGVLHRDLKPSNVMLDRQGRARIMDFGLAVLEMEASGRDEVAGTPTYMAPEQWSGGDLSARTDLYALGLILYEMFTGKKAHALQSLPGQVCPPVRPSAHFPGIHPMIENAILHCLENEPEDRPRSASAVMREIPPRDDTVWREPLPPGEERPESRIARRWRLAALVTIGVLLASMAGNAYLSRHRLPAPLTPQIVDLLVGTEETNHRVAGAWCAFWYEQNADGEYRLYGSPEPVMIQGKRDLLIGKAYNTMRVEQLYEKSGEKFREALREREYYWFLHTKGTGRFASLYSSPRDDRKLLIGAFFLTKKTYATRGPSYLVGDWHGYCDEIAPQNGEPRKRNVSGKVIVVRRESLGGVADLPDLFLGEDLQPPKEETMKMAQKASDCLFDQSQPQDSQ